MNKSAQDREEKEEKSSSNWNTLILWGIFLIYRMWFTNNNLLTLSIKSIDFRDIRDNIFLRDLKIEKSVLCVFSTFIYTLFLYVVSFAIFKSRIHFSSTWSLLQYFKSQIESTAPPIGFSSSLLCKSKYRSNRMRTAYSCDWAGCSREPNRFLKNWVAQSNQYIITKS